MYSNGAQSYRRTSVMTEDPKKLILMCYENIMDNLKMAKEKFAQEDYEGKGRSVSKALDIVNELLRALDFKNGGSVAKNLEALYVYVSRRIIEADLKKDLEAIDEVIGILEELQSAWKEIILKQVGVYRAEQVERDPEKGQTTNHISV